MNLIKKRCAQCKKNKKQECFVKQKRRPDGLCSWCKECAKRKNSDYKKTIKGIVFISYTRQKKNSIKRGHPLPNYSKEELLTWVIKQKKFSQLYKSWVNSGYKTNFYPSCDRIYVNKPYTLNNLQLTTWKQNFKNGVVDRSKPVLQMNMKNNSIKKFVSISEASRQTQCNLSGISAVCLGKYQTSGGYKWKFIK